MNVVKGILEQLKRNGKVAVPEFGVFFTENAAAIVDSKSKTILPPAKQIYFDANFTIDNDSFLQQLSKENNISLGDAKIELRKQTDYWKNMVQTNQELIIDGVGTFQIIDHQISFLGERIQNGTPDFFGLEKINIHEIKNSKRKAPIFESNSGNYKFNNSILWIFLLLIPLSGLLYFGITQQEKIFGKKSFDDYSVKNATHRIEESNFNVDFNRINATADSLKLADSLKNDSLAKTKIVPTNKTPNKKWKPRKHQNH